MSTDILMPALSPTMTEGKLARWLKKEGDPVAPGDVIAEIETDKAMMEVEAIDEGVIDKILVSEGTEGVAVNTPIARMNGDGAEEAPKKAAATADAPKEEKTKTEPAEAKAKQAPVPRRSIPRRRSPRPRRRRTRTNSTPRPRRRPSAKPCAMRWPRRCGPMATSS